MPRRWPICANALWPVRWSPAWPSIPTGSSPISAAWTAHLDQLGISALKVNPDPVMVATEGALWGSVKAHGFLPNTVIVSDDAGQFNVGQHGLCWVHAERLVHKLDAFTDEQRKAQRKIRELIWRLYRDLKAYRQHPTRRRKAALRARFDRIFTRKTGFVTLDRLLARLHANKAELLMVLDRPEIPLHTNGSENDIRCQVTKRKISAGTRSDPGRDCRDAFLALSQDLRKARNHILGLSRSKSPTAKPPRYPIPATTRQPPLRLSLTATSFAPLTKKLSKSLIPLTDCPICAQSPSLFFLENLPVSFFSLCRSVDLPRPAVARLARRCLQGFQTDQPAVPRDNQGETAVRGRDAHF